MAMEDIGLHNLCLYIIAFLFEHVVEYVSAVYWSDTYDNTGQQI